jgi:hypothetical protein
MISAELPSPRKPPIEWCPLTAIGGCARRPPETHNTLVSVWRFFTLGKGPSRQGNASAADIKVSAIP